MLYVRMGNYFEVLEMSESVKEIHQVPRRGEKSGGARTEEKFCSDYTYDKVFCHNFNKCYNEI